MYKKLDTLFAIAGFILVPSRSLAFRLTPSLRLHASLSSRHNHLSNTQVYATDSDNGIGVGIDLGTTHSAIAILDPQTGLPTIVPIPENGRTVPSVVTLQDHDEEPLVGRPAIAKEAEMGSYRNVKRILGRGVTAAQESSQVVPFLQAMASTKKTSKPRFKKHKAPTLTQQINEAQEHPALLMAPGGRHTTIMPTEISAHILRKLLRTVEEATQQPVTRAVIGVPAYFHDAQREATLEAAKLAGLEQVKLLREPEAAALAYGVGKQQQQQLQQDADQDELVLVFDLGGGTYDVSMLLVGGGLTEIITTSGNSQLGGSDFDAKVAQHLRQVMAQHGFVVQKKPDEETCLASDAIVRSAELIRIYLSNNRKVKLALPLEEEAWSHMPQATTVILPLDFEEELTTSGVSNSTHVLCELKRKDMERMCQDELLALLRPIREVAIMAGALLPGDTSPTIVQAAMDMEEEQDNIVFEDFYKQEDESTSNQDDSNDVDDRILAQLDEMSMKERKKAQQRGRKKARDVTKRERKYRQEKRKLAEQPPVAADSSENVKVRDGISGRPISRVVLVGGATRMPAIGRLLAALTGVVPQKTVNPDEAVALGCAVHVGVLDGKEDLGTVLNPMQAAILRAVAEQRQREGLLEGSFDDEEDFEEVEFY